MVKACRRRIVFILTAVFLCAVLFLAGSVREEKARAETISSLVMESGASVRLSGENAAENGLRFKMTMDKTEYEAILAETGEGKTYSAVEFGILIAPSSYDEENALDEKNVFGIGGEAIYDWAEYIEGEWIYTGEKIRIINLVSAEMAEYEGEMVLYGAATNLGADSDLLIEEFIGKGYILFTMADGTQSCVFANANDNVRSMAYVAQMAIENDESLSETEKSWLQTNYVSPVTDREANYTVEYYLYENGEYVLSEEHTEVLSGNIDSSVTAEVKVFDGFIHNENAAGTVLNGKIWADGSLVLKLFYDQKENTKVLFDYEDNVIGGYTGQGLPAQISDEKAYSQTRSVKVETNGVAWVQFILNNEIDISNGLYTHIFFYVYAEADAQDDLWITPFGASAVLCEANRWERIEIAVEDYKDNIIIVNSDSLRAFYIDRIALTNGIPQTVYDYEDGTFHSASNQAEISVSEERAYSGERALKAQCNVDWVGLIGYTGLDLSDERFTKISFYIYIVADEGTGWVTPFYDDLDPSSGTPQSVATNTWVKVELEKSAYSGKTIAVNAKNLTAFYIDDIVFDA